MSEIAHTLKVDCTPAQAYAAVTTDPGIKAWWSRDSEIGNEVGSRHTMRFKKDDRTVTMVFRIDELEPARRVVWTCTENGNPLWPGTRLVFEFDSDGAATRVRFQHAGFQETGSPMYKMTVDGWQHFMASLKSYLDTGTGTPA